MTLRQVTAQSWRWVRRFAAFAISIFKALFTLVVVLCILFFQWVLSPSFARVKRVKGATSQCKRSMRTDTIAACASAVGAIASAFLAAYALTYVSHQEQIARDQLQATYLANLYSKQIENFAGLQSKLDKLWLLSIRDQLLAPHINTAAEAENYRSTLGKNAFEYKEMHYQIITSVAALKLLTPRNFHSSLQIAQETAATIYSEIESFLTLPYKEDSLKKFVDSIDPNLQLLLEWNEVVSECVQVPLSQGITITEERVKACGIGSQIASWQKRTQ